MGTLARSHTASCASPNCLLAVVDNASLDETIVQLLRHTERAPDQAVFDQGDPTHGWFWLCEGRIQLVRSTPAGRRQILGDVHPGQTFGMEALTHEPTYDKSAVAVAESRLVSISMDALPPELLREPAMMAEICDSFVKQTMELQQRLKDVLTNGMRERIVSTLISLVGEHPVMDHDAHASAHAVTTTNHELAAMVGTTPQTVSSCLSHLQHRGVIKRRRGTIEFLDLDALTDLTDLA